MTILVCGANGQLGNSLRLLSVGSAHQFIFSGISDNKEIGQLHRIGGKDVPTDTLRLDITDATAIRKLISDRGVQVIINCAAYTDVEAAEDKPELARQLNVDAVRNLAEACKSADTLLVHISTDYVFGATSVNTPIRENASYCPQGIYAHSKADGERVIAASGCRAIIIRSSWLYSEFGHNFVKTMLALTASRPSVNVVCDQVGTPTYARNLASVILQLIDYHSTICASKQASATSSQVVPITQPSCAIYNYSDEGVCSWYDFATAIAQEAGQVDCQITPCRSSEYPSRVSRPAYSVLDKSLIRTTLQLRIPHWTLGVKQVLSALIDSL